VRSGAPTGAGDSEPRGLGSARYAVKVGPNPDGSDNGSRSAATVALRAARPSDNSCGGTHLRSTLGGAGGESQSRGASVHWADRLTGHNGMSVRKTGQRNGDSPHMGRKPFTVPGRPTLRW